jgi:hypothetical protein
MSYSIGPEHFEFINANFNRLTENEKKIVHNSIFTGTPSDQFIIAIVDRLKLGQQGNASAPVDNKINASPRFSDANTESLDNYKQMFKQAINQLVPGGVYTKTVAQVSQPSAASQKPVPFNQCDVPRDNQGNVGRLTEQDRSNIAKVTEEVCQKGGYVNKNGKVVPVETQKTLDSAKKVGPIGNLGPPSVRQQTFFTVENKDTFDMGLSVKERVGLAEKSVY